MTSNEYLDRTKMSIIVGMVAVFALALIFISVSADGADVSEDDEYYFSGALMESLSDSNGITEEDYKVAWTHDKVLGYAIVSDYAYVADKSGYISKIGLKDGKTVAYVKTGTTSGTDFLTVGGGYVLNTLSGAVYDLDLKQQYSLSATSSQAYYEDGYWYIVKTNKECVCCSAVDEDPSSPTNVQSVKWTSNFIFYIDMYTLPVSLAFNDGYIFYPGIGASDNTQRVLYCVDKETGQQTDMFDMSEIKATYWNSGFIYCEGNTVAVTTHWDTMFAKVRLGPDYKTIFMVDVDSKGKFVTSTARYLSNGYDDSYGSCLVMIDGLGYAQTGSSFKVFDLKTGTVIASTDVDSRLGKTYSNIVVAAGDDGYVRGYVSPAGAPLPIEPVDGLICFEYDVKNNSIRAFDLTVGYAYADNTNSIKIGPNGELIFAKNDGKLYCLTAGTNDDPVDPPLVCDTKVLVTAVVMGVIMLFGSFFFRPS